MKSGSHEIQKTIERQVPRKPGEYKKQWFFRVARHYGCTITKAENLYYREGYSIPNEIYIKLRTHQAVTTAKYPELNDLQKKLEEQDRNISRLEKILAQEQQFKRKLGELLVSH